MPIEQQAVESIGIRIAALRAALGWSQQDLARRVGMSQPWISRVERGRFRGLTVGVVERVLRAMGARLVLSVDAPYLADRRHQADAAHARLASYVGGRLRRADLRIATEVEIGGDRSRGWIDMLACRPASGDVLVIELKTELHDLGAIQRVLSWYERAAWQAARRLDWRPRRVHVWMLLLATEANDTRTKANRALLAAEFPDRARDLEVLIDSGGGRESGAFSRGVAMVDPRSRRIAWIRPLRIDGRRSTAPYADYAAFMRRTRARGRGRDATGG